jgi:uncharacterized protein YajQ (UPF0234 family)
MGTLGQGEAMAKDSSFDIVCNIDMQMVKNAIQQTIKEIRQRYDFKGSKSDVTLEDHTVVLVSESDYRINSIADILNSRLFKSKISLKALEWGKIEPAAGGMVRQKITIQQGIPGEKAKEVVKIIKQTKLKVQAQIQKDQVRVSGKKKDDLQAVIELLKEKDLKVDMQFANFR